MSNKKQPVIPDDRVGFFQNLTNRIKLILRLMADRRVNPLLKLLPIGTIVYFFIPDLVIGPVDDALIIWLGTYLFVELCPPNIVQEHMQALAREIPGTWKDSTGENQAPNEENIVDAEYWDEDK
ncbi:MAG: hypothetical protein A2W33_03140 [Chloroflexi bacterium RBG_16_52_11]|nr:MAG: hypothetical protein A2W33_03140 [Chloroflexi bacterium RBG_16_52_11]